MRRVRTCMRAGVCACACACARACVCMCVRVRACVCACACACASVSKGCALFQSSWALSRWRRPVPTSVPPRHPGSVCSHGVSPSPLGPFKKVQEVGQAFCHNTLVRQTAEGVFAVYHIGDANEPSSAKNCSAGAGRAKGDSAARTLVLQNSAALCGGGGSGGDDVGGGVAGQGCGLGLCSAGVGMAGGAAQMPNTVPARSCVLLQATGRPWVGISTTTRC